MIHVCAHLELIQALPCVIEICCIRYRFRTNRHYLHCRYAAASELRNLHNACARTGFDVRASVRVF